MSTLQELEKRLAALDKEIEETRKRLPAHSVKPPVMMELLDLEDEYDDILQQVERLKKSKEGGLK
jgi:vacuolar-type H+-ATPase subunit D/Vma8